MNEDIPVHPHHKSETLLVNVHHIPDLSDVDIYIGPVHTPITSELPDSTIYRFQNDFKISKHGREGSIENFKMKFYRDFLVNKKFRKQVKNISGKTLADASYPKISHGEPIIDLVERINREDFTGVDVLDYIESRVQNIDPEDLGEDALKYRKKALDKLNVHSEGEEQETNHTQEKITK